MNGLRGVSGSETLLPQNSRPPSFKQEAAAGHEKRESPPWASCHGAHGCPASLKNCDTQLEHLCGLSFVLQHVTAHASSKFSFFFFFFFLSFLSDSLLLTLGGGKKKNPKQNSPGSYLT